MEHTIKQLPLKPILFPRDPVFQGKISSQSSSPSTILLKHFPKFINHLKIDLPRGPLATRLKHIKLIKSLSLDDTKKPHNNLWRLIISNKAKVIQHFHCASDGRYATIFSKSSFQKLKLLPSQQELDLYPSGPISPAGNSSYSSSSELHYLERSCSYIGMMNSLQVLKISLPDQKFLPLLAKVDHFERILGQLKAFALVLMWSKSHEHQFLQALLNCKTVLKNLIFLELGVFARKEFFQALQSLPNYCNRLCGISFSTSQKELLDANKFSATFDENTCLEDENYLECLEDFQNLKKLRVASYHNLNFLQNAKLPSSLQSLSLEFPLFDWENYENSHLKTSPFYFSLKSLANLEDLSLEFSQPSDKKSINEKYLLGKKSFIESLLKNISRLTQLNIALSRQSYSKLDTDLVCLDFSHFLACISHLSDSLEVLKIEDGAGFLKFKMESLLSSSLHFPKLSSLSLAGEISGLNLESVLGLSSKIELDRIKVESLKELLDVFLLVAQVKDIGNKQVKIKIGAGNLKRDPSDESYFKENYEEVKKRIQGVNLRGVSFTIWAGRKELFFQNEIKSFRDLFGKVDIERNYYAY